MSMADIVVLAEASPAGVTARCNACGWETKRANSELLSLLAAFSQNQPPNNEMKLAILEHRLDHHLEGRVEQ